MPVSIRKECMGSFNLLQCLGSTEEYDLHHNWALKVAVPRIVSIPIMTRGRLCEIVLPCSKDHPQIRDP